MDVVYKHGQEDQCLEAELKRKTPLFTDKNEHLFKKTVYIWKVMATL